MKGSAADVINRASTTKERRKAEPGPAYPQGGQTQSAQFQYLPVQGNGNGPMFRDPPALAPPARNPGVYKELMKKHDRMTSRHF